MILEEAGAPPWTYMELLLVELIHDEPWRLRSGREGALMKHTGQSLTKPHGPGFSVGDRGAVMSALYEQDVTLGREISRVLHKPEI